jgi:hypothetical protein
MTRQATSSWRPWAGAHDHRRHGEARAVVIDVGVNRCPTASSPATWITSGGARRLAHHAGSGGVGPMTIAMLLGNTVKSAERVAGSARRWKRASPEEEGMPPYESGLDKNAANFTPLTPVSFLAKAAYVYPERIAVIHGDVRRNWRETYARCRRLASALESAA